MDDGSRNPDDTPVRRPPFNLEAEQALLGAILINNDRLDAVGSLKASNFFDPLHGLVFQTIVDFVASGRRATPVTMSHNFEGIEGPGMTGVQYLGRLAALAGSYPEAYAEVVLEASRRRSLIVVAETMATAAYLDPDTTAKAIFDNAETTLSSIIDAGRETSEVSLSDALDQSLDLANAAYGRNGTLAGLSTGLADLDLQLGGLQPSDLIVLAGRPAMGKSALATNIAVSVAEGCVSPDTGEVSGRHVHFFSLEMSAEQLSTRILAQKAGISSEKIRRGVLTEADFRHRLVPASTALKTLPLTIDETGGLTLSRIVSRARRLKRRRDTGLIVIDYLGLIGSDSSRRGDNRVQDITAITMGLKALAKELGVPVLLLSQLNRETEKRSDKKPQLSDLRDSGSIEQDADVVLFVFRDEYYLAREEPSAELDNGMANPDHIKWRERAANATGKAEVIIAKHRHGPTGVVKLAFDASRTAFDNLAREG